MPTLMRNFRDCRISLTAVSKGPLSSSRDSHSFLRRNSTTTFPIRAAITAMAKLALLKTSSNGPQKTFLRSIPERVNSPSEGLNRQEDDETNLNQASPDVLVHLCTLRHPGVLRIRCTMRGNGAVQLALSTGHPDAIVVWA